jgi:hypothetical protein
VSALQVCFSIGHISFLYLGEKVEGFLIFVSVTKKTHFSAEFGFPWKQGEEHRMADTALGTTKAHSLLGTKHAAKAS